MLESLELFIHCNHKPFLTIEMVFLICKMDRIITKLEAQKKNPRRISVYLDGEYAFGLERITAAWLQIGNSLTDDKINHLKQQDSVEAAYQRVLLYQGQREHSQQEVRQYLAGKGHEPELIDKVINRLTESGSLNNERFARLWVDNRSTYRPRSHRAIAYELKQKGLSEDVIQNALSTAEPDQELALKIAEKVAPRLLNLEWKKYYEKLGGHLARKGFSYDVIKSVSKTIWDQMVAERSIDDENKDKYDE